MVSLVLLLCTRKKDENNTRRLKGTSTWKLVSPDIKLPDMQYMLSEDQIASTVILLQKSLLCPCLG